MLTLSLSVYLGIGSIPDLLLVIAAFVGGEEQGGRVMTFVVFAGNPGNDSEQ